MVNCQKVSQQNDFLCKSRKKNLFLRGFFLGLFTKAHQITKNISWCDYTIYLKQNISNTAQQVAVTTAMNFTSTGIEAKYGVMRLNTFLMHFSLVACLHTQLVYIHSEVKLEFNKKGVKLIIFDDAFVYDVPLNKKINK